MISFRKKSPKIYNRKWQPDWLMFNDIPFKMISFNIKKSAVIVMIDLQQLWPTIVYDNDFKTDMECPAYRNDNDHLI